VRFGIAREACNPYLAAMFAGLFQTINRAHATLMGSGLMLFALVAAVATETTANAPPATNSPAPRVVSYDKLPFPVGEELTYNVYWSFIRVATATAKFEWTELDGRKLLAIRSTARTSGIANKIYRVDDFMESIVDPATLLPVRYTKQAKEGHYWTHEITTFDHKNRMAHFESKKSGAHLDYPIDADTRDIISTMYFMRTQPFITGTKPAYRCMADEKIYDFWVDVLKEEKVDLERYGATPSVKVEPIAAFNGLFVRTGRVWFWVSRDKRQFMTKMVASVPIAGRFYVELDKVSGPGQDFWVQPPAETKRDTKQQGPL